MGSALSQLSGEGVVGWVFLVAVALSGLCMLTLGIVMIVDRRRHAVCQRQQNERQGAARRYPRSFSEGAATGD